MALPIHFDSSEKYFEECVRFFKKYQFLHSYPNTELLINNVLDEIHAVEDEYVIVTDTLEINIQNDCFLKEFYSNLEKLQVFYDDVEEVTCDVDVPVSPKKKHEIIHLTKEIRRICQDIGCDVVVDFGCGLGYLDQLLFEKTNYKILGLECNEKHYVGAKKRQRKYHESSLDNVKYIKHAVHENSDGNILQFLLDKFKHHVEFCITGLHACADLTVEAINLFLKMEDAKALVLMPCCYHKMAKNGRDFKNFPLSNCLKNIYDRYEGDKCVRVPFLRVGSQPSTVQEQLDDLVFNLLSRAALELYAWRHNCKLKRNKRKPVNMRTMSNNFQTYIEDATANGFTLVNNTPEVDETKTQVFFNLQELNEIWNKITPSIRKKAGLFIILQNSIQPVIENFILYDRIHYMKENGIEKSWCKKILNDKTSPRCLALMARK